MDRIKALNFHRRKHHSALWLIITGLILFITPSISTASQTQTYCYHHFYGENSHLFEWRLESGEQQSLLYSHGNGEEHFNILSPQWASRFWSLVNKKEKTRIEVTREGDRLVMQGTFKGKKISGSEAIDSAPWYQAHSVGLRNLLNSEKQVLQFWTVRPDNLSVRHLRAQRQSLEEIQIAGETQEAMRIRVTAVGIPSWVWHGDYWLRPDNGLLLQYSGRNGLPGTPQARLTIQNIPCILSLQ